MERLLDNIYSLNSLIHSLFQNMIMSYKYLYLLAINNDHKDMDQATKNIYGRVQHKPSSMVLIVTEAFAISTSTSKISPSELCSFMFGIWNNITKTLTCNNIFLYYWPLQNLAGYKNAATGFKIYGHPDFRDNKYLTLTTKLQNIVAHWMTITQTDNLFKMWTVDKGP